MNLNKTYLLFKLDYNFLGIQGIEIIRTYLEEYLFTKENYCYRDIFNNKGKFYFYYCENNPNIIKKIKNNFPTIKFTHQDFNYDFIIKGDELFIEKNEYVYCLMVFDTNKKNEWILGRPFLNKYTFMVDQDGKKILFYSYEDKVKLPGLKKNTSVLIIIFLVIVFSFLGFLLGRKIYRAKIRKHKNILDDEYEYKSEDHYKKNSKIEMSSKLSTDE